MKIAIPNLQSFKLSGVYMIKNLLNNKIYVGSTKMTFKRRYSEHFRKLSSGNHHNMYLSNSVKKYGIENFEFSIIEIIDKSSLTYIRERESFFIKHFNTIKCGYNISDVTSSPPSNKEIKEKISNTLKEKYKTDNSFKERLLKNSNKFIGVPSWNKGLICNNISVARKNMFDDIEVYDLNMNFFRKFDNPLEIEKFSKLIENDLPIPEFVFTKNPRGKNGVSKRFLKNKVVTRENIYRAIRKNITYKGLFFKKVKRKN
jgi:group I intron endonuclease